VEPDGTNLDGEVLHRSEPSLDRALAFVGAEHGTQVRLV
jgi:hypothetical protein